MQTDYHIGRSKGEIDLATVEDRLARIANLEATDRSTEHSDKSVGRNWFTRTLDRIFLFISRYAKPLHVLGLTFTAAISYVYARVVAFTGRLATSGELTWPNVSAPSVVALWHGNAPSLLSPRRLEPLVDRESIDSAKAWLQETLNKRS